jgi:prepilin-type N-terminal cleavage/methylation domain-containing protein
MRDGRSGFTLIELLVIVSIIGILSVVVIVFLTSARSQARQKVVTQEFAQFRNQMEINSSSAALPYVQACNGQAIKNIVTRLVSVTNTPASIINTCYPGGDTQFTTDQSCGCTGAVDWVFWINLGDYDDVDGQDYYTCVGSASANILSKLASGGSQPSGGTCS